MRLKDLCITLSSLLLVAVIGCGGDSDPGEDFAHDTAAAPSGPITIVKGEPGPSFPEARLVISSPGVDEVVTSDSVMVSLDLQGVELKAPTQGEASKGLAYSLEGQHVHVIIDNEPYMAMYKKDSFSVGPLSPGAHALRAFPSRSWHESIKEPGAFVAHNFYVGEKTGEPPIKEGEPLLTYSRPKGTYSGADANSILLDFYIANAELSPDGYRVVASIDGNVIDTLSEWTPYFIENLPDGEHTISLQLIGPDGAPVPGTFNSTERTITVERDDETAAVQYHPRYDRAAGPARP
jgi:hypothetical protein